jgi:serine/threonine-protein kinase
MAEPRVAVAPAQCPVCRQQFPVTAKSCPRHGVALVPLEPNQGPVGHAAATILHEGAELRTEFERRGSDVTPIDAGAAPPREAATVLAPAFQPTREQHDLPTTPGGLAAPMLPSAASAASVMGQTFDGYVTTGILAEGGMGIVYEAQHPILGTQAVVKVLKKSLRDDQIARRRMVTEGQTLSALVHRNVVRVIGFGHLPDGRPWLMMERLVGESLYLYLGGHGPLSITEAQPLMLQIAAGLEATHSLGVVHRDLKPDNIFVSVESDGEKQVKLIDFGIARPEIAAGPPAPDDFKTMAGRFVGTMAYGAPELFLGEACSPASDVYALGCVFFEMLTGKRPFSGTTSLETVRQHVESERPTVRNLAPDVPVAIDELVHAMLSKRPKERPTIDQVRLALRPVASIDLAFAPMRSRTPVWVWPLLVGFVGVSAALIWKLVSS